MGIDVHLAGHYWAFHVPTSVVLALAVIAALAIWTLRRFILAAITG